MIVITDPNSLYQVPAIGIRPPFRLYWNNLAPLHHLVFQDWDASIERQGRHLAAIFRCRWPGHRTVLDVSCGMGTQALALAMNGFQVTASDLSEKEIERARKEASLRHQDIAFSVCDMRHAYDHHGGDFDLVISCDNSLPHLLTDEDLSTALRQMFSCLRPGSGCLLDEVFYQPVLAGTRPV